MKRYQRLVQGIHYTTCRHCTRLLVISTSGYVYREESVCKCEKPERAVPKLVTVARWSTGPKALPSTPPRLTKQGDLVLGGGGESLRTDEDYKP